MKKLLFAVVFSVLVAVAAADEFGKEMSTALKNIECNTNFTEKVINSLVEKDAADPGLKVRAQKLKDTTAQLKNLADQNRTKEFRALLKTTYNQDLKSARVTTKTSKKNVTATVKNRVKDDYKQFRAELEACNVDKLKKHAEARLERWEQKIAHRREVANNLSAKGVNVQGLLNLLSAAETQILGPIRASLSLNNATEIQNAIKGYCPFNGCANGTNYHLAAKFEIEKLNRIIDLLEVNGTTNRTVEARGYLNAAKAALDTVGTTQYTEEQKNAVWNNIKAASRSLKFAVRGNKE